MMLVTDWNVTNMQKNITSRLLIVINILKWSPSLIYQHTDVTNITSTSWGVPDCQVTWQDRLEIQLETLNCSWKLDSFQKSKYSHSYVWTRPWFSSLIFLNSGGLKSCWKRWLETLNCGISWNKFSLKLESYEGSWTKMNGNSHGEQCSNFILFILNFSTPCKVRCFFPMVISPEDSHREDASHFRSLCILYMLMKREFN